MKNLASIIRELDDKAISQNNLYELLALPVKIKAEDLSINFKELLEKTRKISSGDFEPMKGVHITGKEISGKTLDSVYIQQTFKPYTVHEPGEFSFQQILFMKIDPVWIARKGLPHVFSNMMWWISFIENEFLL